MERQPSRLVGATFALTCLPALAQAGAIGLGALAIGLHQELLGCGAALIWLGSTALAALGLPLSSLSLGRAVWNRHEHRGRLVSAAALGVSAASTTLGLAPIGLLALAVCLSPLVVLVLVLVV